MTRVHATAISFGLALLTSCSGPPERAEPGRPAAQAAEAPQPESTKTPSPSPATTEAARPPAATGAHAYVNVENVGVHVIDDEGFRLLYAARGPVRDMVEHGGQLLLLSSYAVLRVSPSGEAQTLAEIGKDTYAELGAPRAFGTVDGRSFWVAGAAGVGHFTDTWSITSLASIRDDTPPRALAIAVDHEGVPWLTWGGLHQHREGRWTTVDASAKLPPSVLGLRADIEGQAMLVYGGCAGTPLDGRCTLARERGEELTSFEIPATPCADYGWLTLSSNGARAALGSSCGLARLDLSRPDAAPELLSTAAGVWTGQPLRGLAIDDGGRLWAGTNGGLAIVDAAGERSDLPIGQLSDLSGAVTAVLVTGEGPPAPALGRQRKGGLVATLVTTDEGGARVPIANARVELCPSLTLQPAPNLSPCTGVEPTLEATTSDAGELRVEDIPIGHYYIGVELGDRWRQAVPKALNMRAGMTGNVGKIPVPR